MRRFYPSIAIALCALLMSPMGFAQSAPPPAGSSSAGHTSSLSDQPQVPRPPGDFVTRSFRAPAIAPINMGNSNRLEALIRAGKLYLSLEDAITLALEITSISKSRAMVRRSRRPITCAPRPAACCAACRRA